MKRKIKIKRCRVALACGIVFAQSFTSWAQTQTKRDSLPAMPAKVYEKVSPVVAKIRCKSEDGSKEGSGSVVGFSRKGIALILTACHVVASNFDDHIRDPKLPLEFHKNIMVKIGRDSVYVPARIVPTLVLYDATIDVALIATSAPVAHQEVIAYNRSDGVKPGQKVAAVGFPQSDELTQTVGRIIRIEGGFLVFDAEIAPGSSGGPLIDEHGRMIGLSLLRSEQEGALKGEGYARPMNTVLSVVDPWLKNMKLEKIWQWRKYTSRPQRLIKDPVFIASEVGGLVALVYLLSRNSDSPKEFPTAPEPPTDP